jgi:hypothetical protein
MNAQQSKNLIAAARKAREALLSLDPDSIVALELWTAIHRASEPATPRKRSDKSVRFFGPHIHNGGHCVDADDAMAFATGVHEYFNRPVENFASWTMQIVGRYTHSRFDATALRERLTFCACGGKADDHREDKDGNLLECSHCDGCDHFHYQTDTEDTDKQAA